MSDGPSLLGQMREYNFSNDAARIGRHSIQGVYRLVVGGCVNLQQSRWMDRRMDGPG